MIFITILLHILMIVLCLDGHFVALMSCFVPTLDILHFIALLCLFVVILCFFMIVLPLFVVVLCLFVVTLCLLE